MAAKPKNQKHTGFAGEIPLPSGQVKLNYSKDYLTRDKDKPRSPAQQIKLRLADSLILLNLLNIIIVIGVILLSPGLLRTILVIPYLLFSPGYALLAAMFVKKDEINGTERLVLSVGLSVVILVLIGLFLNYSVWGIRLVPAMFWISGFVLLVSIIAWFRLSRLEKIDRHVFMISNTWLVWGKGAGGGILTVLIIAGILGALVFLGYLVKTPGSGETFSEFYILGQSNVTADYPRNMKVGETGIINIGIINRESKEVTYTIKVFEDNNEILSTEPVVLEDKQKWEGEINFTATSPGENKKVEFVLYRDGEDNVYKNLHLWINVTE